MPPNDQDRLTFEAAVKAFSESLYRVAFRLTGNHHTANELVQETYLGAWKNISQLKDHTKLRGWMFAILRNQFSKICQRKKVNTSELGEIDVIPMARPHSADLQETGERSDSEAGRRSSVTNPLGHDGGMVGSGNSRTVGSSCWNSPISLASRSETPASVLRIQLARMRAR